MKQYLSISLKLTGLCIVFFSGLYTLLIWGIAQLEPNRGEGERLYVNENIVGYALEGQAFSQDKYFWSRPSAVAFNAAGSGGSNKGPSNPDYLKDLDGRIDSFLVHNPSVEKKDIPSELVTASGSGLDPDLSPIAAYIQVPRIAKARNLTEDRVKTIVDLNVEKPLLGIFGPEKVNVLKMNLSLDRTN
jgi:potassium-transporting ATPase KdpC subunit